VLQGEFTAFITAVGLVFEPIRKLSGTYAKIQDAIAASERVFEVLDTKPTIEDGQKHLDEDIKKIEFQGVSLKYEGAYALKDINVTIQDGQKIALVGDSGGGKSTFIAMLLRFYDSDEGVVKINEVDIKEYNLASLKHHISLVTQRVYIFQDSLAANVAYGEEYKKPWMPIQKIKSLLPLRIVSQQLSMQIRYWSFKKAQSWHLEHTKSSLKHQRSIKDWQESLKSSLLELLL